MAAEQTKAIVLRTVEFSETSLVVTLLTEDFGRVSAIAKGARRPKGPFEGSLDLLAVCRVVVLRKTSEALDLLTEAKLHRRFRAGERSLARLYGGYYVAELLRQMTDDHDPHRDVYELSIRTLEQIDGNGNVAATLAYFELQLLRMLGHAPGTEACTDCGAPIAHSRRRVAFSLSSGGVVCDRCRGRQRQTISTSTRLIDEIRRLQSQEMQLPVAIAQDLYGELRAILNRFIPTVTGSVPRMQPYLPKVSETGSTA